jgi:hypothetical protein
MKRIDIYHNHILLSVLPIPDSGLPTSGFRLPTQDLSTIFNLTPHTHD